MLKAAAKAHQALGELKGLAVTIPNQYILLATLSLQEAKESSEIENIITTQDDLYRSYYKTQQFISTSAKQGSIPSLKLVYSLIIPLLKFNK